MGGRGEGGRALIHQRRVGHFDVGNTCQVMRGVATHACNLRVAKLGEWTRVSIPLLWSGPVLTPTGRPVMERPDLAQGPLRQRRRERGGDEKDGGGGEREGKRKRKEEGRERVRERGRREREREGEGGVRERERGKREREG